MNFLDSSFLVDYLQGESYTGRYLAEHGGIPHFCPSIVTFELGYGALKHPSPKQTIATVSEALAWVEVVPFDEGAAMEAAEIRDELRRDGDSIPTQDVMIAGVVRDAGGTLVTRDDDFTGVDGLDVELLSAD